MNLLKTSKLLFLPAAAMLTLPAYAQDAVTVARKPVSRAVMPGPAPAGQFRSNAWFLISPSQVHGPGATSCADGCYYEPADLLSIYAINSIANADGGSGITVGIVDAYYNPQTEADLKAFNAEFGLPGCTIASGCLTIVNQTGCVIGSTGCTNPGHGAYAWAPETDLDVQTVHSLAPKAKILLVVCDSASDANLYAGVQIAYANADVVSNSYGGAEDAAAESIFSASTVPLLFSAGIRAQRSSIPAPAPTWFAWAVPVFFPIQLAAALFGPTRVRGGWYRGRAALRPPAAAAVAVSR